MGILTIIISLMAVFVLDNIYTEEIMVRKRLLKKLFVGIYLLNLLEGLLIYILVRSNMSQGITIFMKPIASEPLVLAFIKVGFVLYMFSLIYKRMEKAKVSHYRVATVLFTLLLGFYAVIVWMEVVIFGTWVLLE